MGRITVFCADGCPHSKRVSSALRKRDIPFVEISITRFPHKRKDMVALSNRISTPQVFFNTRHVGGADDTIQLLQRWEEEDKNNKRVYVSAYERYHDEIGQHYDPTNPRLAIPAPATAVKVDAGPPRGPKEYSISLPWEGETATVLQMTETLKQIMPEADKKKGFTVHHRAFSGAQAVRALMNHYQVDSSQALALAQHLLEEQVIVSASASSQQPSSLKRLELNAIYRLQCHAEPAVLNSYRVWKEDLRGVTAEQLLYHLSNLMSGMLMEMTDGSGCVDFVAGQEHPLYPVFEEAVCALQKVSLRDMKDNEKMAFGINLYNLMIKYAFIKVGAGTSDFSRLAFYNRVSFNVGGYVYSFQDWENGILRGNRKAPYALQLQFIPKDLRLEFVVQKLDCRVHFALNGGGRSCPPVNYYTSADLDEELQMAAAAFGEDEANVSIDTKHNQLRLSRIYSWYKADFVEQTKDYPAKVLTHLYGLKRQTLERFMSDGNNKIKTVFGPYDWSAGAKRISTFTAASLKSKERSVVKSLLTTSKSHSRKTSCTGMPSSRELQAQTA